MSEADYLESISQKQKINLLFISQRANSSHVLTSDHQLHSRWTALVSKIGFTHETLRAWVNEMEVDSGKMPSVISDARAKTAGLEMDDLSPKNNISILL